MSRKKQAQADTTLRTDFRLSRLEKAIQVPFIEEFHDRAGRINADSRAKAGTLLKYYLTATVDPNAAEQTEAKKFARKRADSSYERTAHFVEASLGLILPHSPSELFDAYLKFVGAGRRKIVILLDEISEEDRPKLISLRDYFLQTLKSLKEAKKGTEATASDDDLAARIKAATDARAAGKEGKAFVKHMKKI